MILEYCHFWNTFPFLGYFSPLLLYERYIFCILWISLLNVLNNAAVLKSLIANHILAAIYILVSFLTEWYDVFSILRRSSETWSAVSSSPLWARLTNVCAVNNVFFDPFMIPKGQKRITIHVASISSDGDKIKKIVLPTIDILTVYHWLEELHLTTKYQWASSLTLSDTFVKSNYSFISNYACKTEMDGALHEAKYCREMQLTSADIQKRKNGCPSSTFGQFWTAFYAIYMEGQEW